MNTQCYKLKEFNYKDPIFEQVDATYIIHLEGNGRLESINSQLKRFHPSKIVYILFNKGYKNCKKDSRINTPSLDLVDAFLTIFKDAKAKNYDNILILEDDFFFDDKILEKKHASQIDDFLIKKKNTTYVYYLGTIPYIQSEFGSYHKQLFLSTGTHSCIYSNKIINYTLKNVDQYSITDWDVFLNYKIFRRYNYYRPMCYQTFPSTDNQKSWGDTNIKKMSANIIVNTFNSIKLDTQHEPGYDILYKASKFMFWFIIITVVTIIFSIYSLTKKKIKWFKKSKKNWFTLIFCICAVYPFLLFFVILLYVYTSFYFIHNIHHKI